MDREKIENTLLDIGIPASINGFKYIVDAVIYIDNYGNGNIMKKLYPNVAEINKTTANRVERSIRHALKIGMGEHCNKRLSEYYIGNGNNTNASSLSLLHLRLKNKNVKSQKYKWVKEVHDFELKYNGWRFLIIYGKGPDGWFVSIPNFERCIEISSPDNVRYNSEKLEEIMSITGSGKILAESIKKNWEEL